MQIPHEKIPREQVEKILTVGKTDLIPRFISKKGRLKNPHYDLCIYADRIADGVFKFGAAVTVLPLGSSSRINLEAIEKPTGEACLEWN